mmetsp:Transcript_14993/g.16201  ORF Transcript_14993/g.16201 Transcript_14993/m.16201 type:complete len:81 (+) Transcript_14993:234-476(+)
MRVKANIFGPWEEEHLDHQVKVMYTHRLCETEKRDMVEYTSLGYLHSPHTRCSPIRGVYGFGLVCVPLLIDVWPCGVLIL